MPLKSFRTLLEEPDVKFGQERLIKVLAAVAGPNMKFGNYDVLEHDHPYQAGLSDLARQQGDRRG